MTDPLDAHRARLARGLARLEGARQRARLERRALRDAEALQRAAAEATTVAQAVAERVQASAHAQVASIASRCLAAVFDRPYELRIHFERRRGRTEARLAFHRDGHEYDPVEAAGQGQTDVAAFALRLACLVLGTPRLRPLLVLDEPMRLVSRRFRPRVHVLLEALCAELGLQVIMVTHDPALQAGTVVEVGVP